MGHAAIVSDATPTPTRNLKPLPYHREVVAYLKSEEAELWKWASSPTAFGEYAEEMRTSLLKASYRLDAEGHPDLVARAAAVAEKLGVRAAVTLYQAAGESGLNAALYYLPGEAHIVFSGPILSALKGAEIDSVLAHELAHFRLWELANSEFLVAQRLLTSAVNDPRASSSHHHTARRLSLYTEIFADRGSLIGCDDLHAAVAALVKTETGLQEVSAASYLRQADEIFSREEAISRGIEHPETFIRARALRMWAEDDPALDDWLEKTINGSLLLSDLDLPDQHRVTMLTRRFLGQFLRPTWMQGEVILGHARAFFPDFAPATEPNESVADELRGGDDGMENYLVYLLMDFVAMGDELKGLPLASAFLWSERLDIADDFDQALAKEFDLGKRMIGKMRKEAGTLIAQAEAGTRA